MKKTLRFKKSNTLNLFAAALLATTLGLTSCSKKNDVAGTSYIQFTNVAETASPMDFYANNKKETATPIAYDQSTDYFSIASVTQPGQIKSSASGTSLASITLNPQAGVYYSVYYFEGSTVAYQDDLTAPQSGKARVRFINFNLQLQAKTNFGVSGGAEIASGLINYQNSDYYNVDPATTFTVDTSNIASPILNIPTTIQAGHIYTVYLSGQTLTSLKATVLLQK